MTLAECGALIKLKILITGGAGFIGSNLADKLVMLGHKVSVIDNHKARINLEKPNYRVAPGQACVIYSKNRVLGGGWISGNLSIK